MGDREHFLIGIAETQTIDTDHAFLELKIKLTEASLINKTDHIELRKPVKCFIRYQIIYTTFTHLLLTN